MGGLLIDRDEAPAPKRKWRVGLWLLGIFLGLFVYVSIRPVMRLRNDPPAEFLGLAANPNSGRLSAEEQLARAYWDCAVQYVQWQYAFGTPLPDSPPPEFSIDENGSQAGTGGATAARIRYWQQLRNAWVVPQTWEKSYEWNTSWLTEGPPGFQQAARQPVDNILQICK